MPWTDAFNKHEQLARTRCIQETWGHLAPEKNVTYPITIIFAKSEYNGEEIVIIKSDTTAENSPWLYEDMYEALNKLNKLKAGCVYKLVGTYRNHKIKGKTTLLVVPSET